MLKPFAYEAGICSRPNGGAHGNLMDGSRAGTGYVRVGAGTGSVVLGKGELENLLSASLSD